MFSYFLLQFLRSRTVVFSFVIIFVLGVVSILIGNQFLNQQHKAIEKLTEQQADHIKKNLEYHADDIGLLLYYLHFTHINKPDNIAGFSIGQSDINPNIQHINILNLEGQKYDTDLANPVNLQSGNLDLSFVIIYLFPLLIISFMYHLLSEETENGRWHLISVQTRSKSRYLFSKFSVRAISTFLLLLLLLIIAKITMDIPLDKHFAAIALLSVLYLTFWFALCWLIVSLKKKSHVNILSLLSLWLILMVVLPASLNHYIANALPVPEALTTMIEQRDGYHTKWDTDKTETMKKFYKHYPDFELYGYPTGEGFSWLWYYAMQQMGDDESAEKSKAFRDKILKREGISRSIGKFIPNIHTQLSFNDIAGTNLKRHMQFMNATTAYHEGLRLFFYPKIFDKKPAKTIDWKKFQPEHFKPQNRSTSFAAAIPLCVFSLLLFAISWWNIRRV